MPAFYPHAKNQHPDFYAAVFRNKCDLCDFKTKQSKSLNSHLHSVHGTHLPSEWNGITISSTGEIVREGD
jgi:hypothetical protein